MTVDQIMRMADEYAIALKNQPIGTYSQKTEASRLELKAAVEELAKDAARYKFLREHWFTMSATYHDDDVQFYLNSTRYTNATEEKLDAAIDAAMKGQS